MGRRRSKLPPEEPTIVTKYIYGDPVKTESIVVKVAESLPPLPFGEAEERKDGFRFTAKLAPGDRVNGLGEAMRGINKRGGIYESCSTDHGDHAEDMRSLYGAYNFILIDGEKKIGIFFDYPGYLTFDVCHTKPDELVVTAPTPDIALYYIIGPSPRRVVSEFRRLIGPSYIPPRFAFGYGQSRFGYKTMDDFREVVDRHRGAGVPLDMVYMDIDYMDGYRDFTVNKDNFPDFPAFVKEMRDRGVRLIPIIDAGIKAEEGYSVYDDGVKNDVFCKRADGTNFEAVVWPGWTCFADVFRPEVRSWFGRQYGALVEAGIEGFWNDMNEPATFCTREGLEEAKNGGDDGRSDVFSQYLGEGLRIVRQLNNREDHKRFYNIADGRRTRHDKVHNLYGGFVARAASEGLSELYPDRKFLLFSRSSCIGAHRYGGIWTGDNSSWWAHLLLNLKMLPSLNMCGFLYVGADIGGFSKDTTRELLLRWLALGVFTPLMRNHNANTTRRQEFYQFDGAEDFRSVISVRYRLLPYLYNVYMKAATYNDMMFMPLSFAFPNDPIACETEDQLLLGDECMIAPVYTENARGRSVYLPERMLCVIFGPDGAIRQEALPKGLHYIEVALNEVPLFIRKSRSIPVADAAETVDGVDPSTLRAVGWEEAEQDVGKLIEFSW